MNGGSCIAALVLGLVSSVHCVGMCGVFAFSLSFYQANNGGRLPVWLQVLAYHTGRILVYGLIGLLFGLVGRSFYLAGVQQWFSIGAGIILFTVAILKMLPRVKRRQAGTTAFSGMIARLMARAMRLRGLPARFLLGMANGLLPCGMVYFAALSAVALQPGAVGPVWYMLAFGLGTFPLLLVLSFWGGQLPAGIRLFFRRLVPATLAALAVLLVLRGMGMGIPFLSPALPGRMAAAVQCHL
jgi:sulfite exporter TauE/SafE